MQDWMEMVESVTGQKMLAPESIPNIELYMDQILTLLDRELGGTKRNEEDKIMTKTMINNYSKEKLLPPSNKKKYSSHHILLLALIYELKQVLSIQDIHLLLGPMVNDEEALLHFYQVYMERQKEQRTLLKQQMQGETVDDLRTIAAALAARAVLETRLAERLLDAIDAEEKAMPAGLSEEEKKQD